MSLDLSTSTGFAILDSGKLTDSGLVKAPIEDFNVNDFPERSSLYPYNIIDAAEEIAKQVTDIARHAKPDTVVIENTCKGRNRNSQRALEFIHFAVIRELKSAGIRVSYIDVSRWRSILGLKLSQKQRQHNRWVSQGKERGRVTPKHLSVAKVNEIFGLEYKLKDNDICDAILIGYAWYQNSLNPTPLTVRKPKKKKSKGKS